MAKCSECGNSAGLLSTICDNCASKVQIERERAEQEASSQQARILERAEEEQAAAEQQKVAQWKKSAISDLAAGKPIYIYDSIYLPVDSFVNDDQIGTFELSALQAAGLAGWKVLSVIPRTVGVALTNVSYGSNSGETWGAGLGGNVAGVHVLLCREVSNEKDSDLDDVAIEIATEVIAKGYDLY
jgi:hypothetical protein